MDSCRSKRLNGLQFFGKLQLGIPQIDLILKVQKVRFGYAKISAEAQGSIYRDASSIMKDVLHPRDRYMDIFGKLISRDAQWFHKLLK